MKLCYQHKNKKEDITKFVTQVQWSGSATEASRTLEFSLVSSPYDDAMSPPVLAQGDIIYFYDDNKLLFYGRVLIRERIGEKGENSYTARDLMNNIIKSKVTKKFKKKTPEYIAKACAKAAGVSCGSLYKTKYKIKKQYATEESCYNILMNAYAKAAKKKGVQFMPYMSGSKLTVVKKGKIVTTLSDGADITAIRITNNADDMVNRVNIYSQKGKKTGTVKKASWVQQFGVYQEAYTKEGKSNGKKEAKAMLQGASKEMEIEAIGNNKCIAGMGVYVYDKATKTTGNFWIESDSHTYSNGVHTMTLQMTFKNTTERPDVNYDSGSSSSSKKGTKYKYVKSGKMQGKKITGLRFTAYAPGEGGYNDMRGRRLKISEKTAAFDKAVSMYGRKAYGMKIQIWGTGTKLDGKIYTVRDTGTGNNHTVDILMSKSKVRSWNNPHGYVIIARSAKFKKKKVKVKTSGGSSGKSKKSNSKASKIVSFAKKYKGKVRYVWGATNVAGGRSDCSGFTQYVFKKAAGVNLPRVTYDQVKRGRKISKRSNLKAGDLVFFNTSGSNSHVGIYIGSNKFIHCGCSHGVWINSLGEGYYRSRFSQGRRIV